MNNRILKKAALFIIILACGCSVWFACGRNEQEVLEVGIFAGSNWDVANPNSYAIIDKAIEKFEEAHPGVQVRYESGVQKADYSEWLTRKMLSGKAPDVFMVLDSDFDKLASIGALQELDGMIAQDKDFDKQAFYKTALNTGRREGVQMALPYETVPTLMFVNRTLLNKYGIQVPDNDWTWDDLYDICEIVTRDTNGDGMLDQFGTYNYEWINAVYSNGANIFEWNGKKAYFNDSKVIEAIKFMKKLNDLNQGHVVTQDDFDSGDVAFMPLSYADYRTYKTYPYKIKKYTNFQWDCITLPAGSTGGNVSEVKTLLMGISRQSKKTPLAWEFLKQLTYDEDIQMSIFQYSQGASVLKKVTNSQEAEKILQADMENSEKVINNQLLSDVIEQGTIVPKFELYEDAFSLAESEISKIISEGKNVDSSMKIFQRSISQFLQK